MNVPEAPAFVYLKDLHIGILLNKNAEPIVYTEDPAEMNWLFNWIIDYEKQHRISHLSRIGEDSKPGPILPAQNRESLEKSSKPYPGIPAWAGSSDRKSAHAKGGRKKRQLIGEQVGPTRVHQLRLFQTHEEAERWAKEGLGRRFRFATVGSVGWTRALEEQMKIAQLAPGASLPAANKRYQP